LGRKLIFIIIAVVMLLVLAGGGAAAYFLVFAKKPAPEAVEEEPPPAPVKRPAFIPMEPFSIFVEPEGQKVREVILILHLEAPPDNVLEINSKMHVLRDRVILTLNSMEPMKVPARFEAKDLAEIKAVLRKPIEDVMGKGLVTQVLLLNIVAPLKP